MSPPLRLVDDNGIPPLLIFDDLSILKAPHNWEADGLEAAFGRFCESAGGMTVTCVTASPRHARRAYRNEWYWSAWRDWVGHRQKSGKPVTVVVYNHSSNSVESDYFGPPELTNHELDTVHLVVHIFDRSYFDEICRRPSAVWKLAVQAAIPDARLEGWPREMDRLNQVVSDGHITIPRQYDEIYPRRLFLVAKGPDGSITTQEGRIGRVTTSRSGRRRPRPRPSG